VTATAVAPDWLLQREAALCPCACIGRRRRAGMVERTLAGTTALVRQAMFSDDIAAKRGVLQAVDPRVKLVSCVVLLGAAALVRNIAVLVAMYCGALLLAMLSGLTLRFFVTRVWLFIPLFTGLVVAPAAFSFVTPGRIVLSAGTWFGHDVGLTAPGLIAAGLIVSRVAVSVSLVVLLTLTTRWDRLLGALRALLVPRIFVLVLAIAYRYVFLLLDSVTDMYTARRARTVHRDADGVRGRAFVAATAGALFGKAHALSEEVHQAMLSRGYTGDPSTMRATRIRAVDGLWILGTACCTVALIGGDRALGH